MKSMFRFFVAALLLATSFSMLSTTPAQADIEVVVAGGANPSNLGNGCRLYGWSMRSSYQNFVVGNDWGDGASKTSPRRLYCDSFVGSIPGLGSTGTRAYKNLTSNGRAFVDYKIKHGPLCASATTNCGARTFLPQCVNWDGRPGYRLWYVFDGERKYASSNGSGDNGVQDWPGIWNYIGKTSMGTISQYPAPSNGAASWVTEIGVGQLNAYKNETGSTASDTPTNRFKAYYRSRIKNRVTSKNDVTMLCATEASVKDEQTCANITGSSTYQYKAGKSPTTSANVMDDCFIRCPAYISPPDQRTAAQIAAGHRIVRNKNNAGKFIPATVANTNLARGAWCYEATWEQGETRSTTTPGISITPYPYSWITEVQRGNVSFAADTTSTKKDIVTQTSEVVYSPWGELINQAALDNELPDAMTMMAAINETKTAPHATLDLSDENKEALGEGGVMNIIERATEGTFGVTTTRTERRGAKRKGVFNVTNTGVISPTPTWGSLITDANWILQSITNEIQPDVRQVPNTRLWQQMNVHCNDGGFKSVLYEAIPFVTNDPTRKISASARTFERNTSNPQWATGSGYDPTAYHNFYDRECSYAGVRADDNNNIIGSGVEASDENSEGSAGVVYDQKHAPAEATFFRDNEGKDFKFDLYVPDDVPDLINYDGSPALTTTITRWSPGTPLPANTSEKGTFMLKTKTGSADVFSNSTANPPQQKNFSTTGLGKGRTYGIVSGQHNTFTASGNWPSDSGKPQVLTAKWEYDPQVSSTFFTDKVGYGGRAGARSGEIGTVWNQIQGKVYSRANRETSPTLPEEMRTNTGGGITNNLDREIAFGTNLDGSGKWITEPSAYSPYYYSIKFIRATAE